MKTLISLVATMMIVSMASAQTIGDTELDDAGSYGEKKLKRSPRKVYIAEFRVFYQMLYTRSEETREGVNRGATSASVAVGINGVSEQDLIETTDKLYAHYLSNLKAQGFEIVSVDEAAKTKYYQGWERKQGGSVSNSPFKGYAMAIPTGFTYLVKGTTKTGKNKATFTDGIFKAAFEMGKITAIRVNVIVPFISDAESRASKVAGSAIGGISKVVVEPDLRLGNVAIGGSINNATTKTSYIFTENKIAADVYYSLGLKKPVEISGVFENQKIKAVAAAEQKNVVNMGAVSLVYNQEVAATNFQIISCDPEMYARGVLEAASQYLDQTLELFFTYQQGGKPGK